MILPAPLLQQRCCFFLLLLFFFSPAALRGIFLQGWCDGDSSRHLLVRRPKPTKPGYSNPLSHLPTPPSPPTFLVYFQSRPPPPLPTPGVCVARLCGKVSPNFPRAKPPILTLRKILQWSNLGGILHFLSFSFIPLPPAA